MSLLDSQIKQPYPPESYNKYNPANEADSIPLTNELQRFFCGLNLTVADLEAVQKFMDDEDYPN